jgi:hypothetical protein
VETRLPFAAQDAKIESAAAPTAINAIESQQIIN